MKSFRRTKWKPKQKLQRKDIQILLTEYRVSKNLSYASVSLCITIFAIVVASIITTLINPSSALENIVEKITIVGLVLGIFFFGYANYYKHRASKIAKVLGIEKRLKRYGIESE